MSLIKQAFLLCTLCIGITSCSTDTDDTSVSAPSDFYYPGETPIPFYSNGGVAPNIDWGNEIGLFSLDTSYTGVSLDETTGVLSWNEDLPLGSNVVLVTATNSAGFATTSPNLLHQFSGVFNGGHNTDPSSTTVTTTNLDITFNVDGSLSITDNGNTGTGTWHFDPSGKLLCAYVVSTGSFELELDLTYSVTITPYLEGFKRTAGGLTTIGFVRLDYQL